MTRKSSGSAPTAYRADIDGLRAVAVLLVLAFHFRLVPGSEAGFIGVDIFFVISGFLITSILKRQLDEGTLSLASFYVGRVRRLAPALIATLVLVLAAGSLLLFPEDLISLTQQALASQFYVSNVYYWRNVNYFGLRMNDVFLLHMWSLAVEEQFYLLYPLALWGVHRYQRKRFWAAVALALLISFALNIIFVARKPEATFYLLPTRAWELLTGALLVLAEARRARSRLADEMLSLFGVGLLAAALVGYREDIRFPGYFALLPVVGTACLMLGGVRRTTLTSRVLSFAPIRYVGKISYPLYLVHWPLNIFAGRWMAGRYHLGQRFAMFAVSLLLAAALYHLVENPVRRRNLLALNGHLLRAYAAGLAVTLLIFFVVQQTDGLPQRFPREAIRLAAYVNDKSPPLSECKFTGEAPLSDASFCKIGKPGSQPTWLVYGDSHAWAAYAVFDEWLTLKDEAGLFMFRQACPPLLGLHLLGDEGICHAFNLSIATFLRRHADVSNVVLVSAWREALEGRLTTAPDLLLSKQASLRLFDEQFSATLTYLHDIGKQIYVWEPVPGARGSVPVVMARAVLDDEPARLEFTRKRYMAEMDFFFKALKRNRHLIAASFSPSDALCRSGRCAAAIDGQPAYFDNSHITRSTRDFWVRMLQDSEVHRRIGEPGE